MPDWSYFALLTILSGVASMELGFFGVSTADNDDSEDDSEVLSAAHSTGFGPDYDPDIFADHVLGPTAPDHDVPDETADASHDDHDAAQTARADASPDGGVAERVATGAGDAGGPDDTADEADNSDSDDRLILSQADLAPLVLGPDDLIDDDEDVADDEGTASVYEIDEPDQAPAHIEDFDPASDTLVIQYSPADSGEDPSLVVNYDEETDLTSVDINGVTLATLDGDAGITADDITLTAIV